MSSIKVTYTDHYTEVIIIEGLLAKILKREKVLKWDLYKPKGWEKYKNITDDFAETINHIVESKDLSIEEVIWEG